MMNNVAIAVDRLVVDRGSTKGAVDEVSLQVPVGQVTGLLGPSGCGKTTLMRSVVGVQVVTSGEVTVLGLPAGHRSLRDRVGYVTQAPSVYPDLTVEENLHFFARVLGVDDAEVGRCLEAVVLTEQRRQLVGSLSGGQHSRVSLGVALLGRPEVLVLDEPTVGLDPVLRRELWELFHRLADEDGTTVFVSSHVMDEAERCDRLVLMRRGRVLADDAPAALLERTGTADVEEAFLSLVDAQDRADADGAPAGAGRRPGADGRHRAGQGGAR